MRILYLPSAYSQQRQREKKANIYPVRMAMEAEYYRKQGHEIFWGGNIRIGNENKVVYPEIIDTRNNATLVWKEEKIDKVITKPENLPFLSLPHPDRVFTRAKEYDSGNYKYKPGTHILSASGCWHGACSFCCEQGRPYEVRPVEDVISEIEECKALEFKSLFDDSATFPDNQWCYEFCKKVTNFKLNLGCNLRINSNVDFKLMKNAGFEMVLYGVESANQSTLNRIQKGVKVEDIIPTIKKASEARLSPHICVIFGHPNETDKDAINTLKLVHYLLRRGFAKTAQASFYQVAGETGNESHRKYIPQIYNAAYHLDFWFNQLHSIHNLDDLKYLWLKIKKGLTR